MVGILRMLLIFLFTGMFTGLACADGSPVIVSHKVTGQNEENNTIDVLVQVRNPGKTALSNLTLALVPRRPNMAKRVIQNFATLEAGQSIDFPLQLNMPALAKKEIAPKLLYWAGNYVDDQGQSHEFPITSRTIRVRPADAATKGLPSSPPPVADTGGGR